MSDSPTAHLNPGDTVFVRSTSGVIFEMDVPKVGHARERFDEAIAKGDLVLIDEAHPVTRPDGSIWFVAGPADGQAAKPRRTSKPAPADDGQKATPAKATRPRRTSKAAKPADDGAGPAGDAGGD